MTHRRPARTLPVASIRAAALSLALFALGSPALFADDLRILTVQLIHGEKGMDYGPAAISAFGGTPPYTFSFGPGRFPYGLEMDPATGVVVGVPEDSGEFVFDIVVTDKNGAQASGAIRVFICQIRLGRIPLADGEVGDAYSETIPIVGGRVSYPIARVVIGNAPPGLLVGPTADMASLAVAGVPTTVGTYTFTVEIEDAGPVPYCKLRQELTIDVRGQGMGQAQMAPRFLLDGAVAEPYEAALAVDGAAGPFLYAVRSGSLPPGLVLDPGGAIYGVPEMGGFFDVVIDATTEARSPGTLSQAYTLVVTAAGCGALGLTPASLGDMEEVLATLVRFDLPAGRPPISFFTTGGDLPPGLALRPEGTLVGEPLSAGRFTFRVTGIDGAGCTASRIYDADIRPAGNLIAGQGLGPTNANRVRVFNRYGAPTPVDFHAYAAGRWGTNVTAGDVGGTSDDEVVTGPGAGEVYGPHVRGFDVTGRPMAKLSFYAYGTLKYGVNVAARSFDVDRHAEIVSGAGPGKVFGPHVRGWEFDDSHVTPQPGINLFAFSTVEYGANVALGDLDGDGKAEVLAALGPGPSFGSTVRSFRFDGGTLSAGASFDAFGPSGFGVRIASADVDADGRADVLTSPGPGATLPNRYTGYALGVAATLLPGFDLTVGTSRYGGNPGAANVDGDAAADLLTASGRDPAAGSELRAYLYVTPRLEGPEVVVTPFATDRYGVNAQGGGLGY